MNKKPCLYTVVPCFNETAVLSETAKRLGAKYDDLIKSGKIAKTSRVLFVDDGSNDDTWKKISDLHVSDETFTGIRLSRNRGHQNALLAGLLTAKNRADVVISMDADLQDDIGAMDEMLEKYQEGADIVYGIRSAREKDTWFKRTTAKCFYKLMRLLGADVAENHADYRLATKRVLDELANYKEVNLFLRGVFPLIGYNTATVYYERGERFAGESKYPLKKMLSFAWDGISSFSIKPLRLITALGFLITALSVIILIYSLIMKIIGNVVSGWTFTVCSIWLVGGIQTLSLGVIGEYIGKIYNETKARPKYCIMEDLEKE